MKKGLFSVVVLFCVFILLSNVSLKAEKVGIPWFALYGGTDGDYGNGWGSGVVVSESGDVYSTGFSLVWDTSFYGIPMFPLIDLHGDAFVAKWNKNGKLLWYTFLGGPMWDYGEDIALDKDGNVFVTGDSYSSWPEGTYGTPVNPHNSSNDWYDGFVAKLDPNGNLIWHTFLGGSGGDNLSALAISKQGNIFVSGYSWDEWNTSAYGQPELAFNTGTYEMDVIVAKLSNSGTLQWYTFLGSDYYEIPSDIIVAPGEITFVTGQGLLYWTVQKYGLPVNDKLVDDLPDGFIACLSGAGQFNWYTFIGEDDSAYPHTIDFSSANRIFVSGSIDNLPSILTSTSRTSLTSIVPEKKNGISPVSSKLFVGSFTFEGVKDWLKRPYIAKLSAGLSVDVGPNGKIFVTGSAANDIPDIPNSGFKLNISVEPAMFTFLLKMTQAGNVEFVHKFTNYTFGVGNSIAVYENGILYITGNNYGFTVGVASQAFPLDQIQASGDKRIFLAQINELHTIEVNVKTEGGSAEKEIYEVLPGKDCVINLFPDPGYELYKIIDNSEEVVVANPYILAGVHYDHIVDVYFRLITYPPEMLLSGARVEDNAWILEKEFGELTITIIEHETLPMDVKAYVLYKYKGGVWKEITRFTEAGTFTFNDKYLTPGVEGKYVLKALAADGSVIAESDILIL